MTVLAYRNAVPSTARPATSTPPGFAVQDIAVRYATRSGSIDALHGVSLEVGEGEFVAVLGPSGCGKSTLVKIAAGLLRPTAGGAFIRGQPVEHPGRSIGVAFQKPNLLPWKTVLDNVLLPARIQGLPTESSRQRARELLSLVGLDAFAGNLPFELSGGMQQRVGIARMLVHDPSLLVMDEPFAALDAMTREKLTVELQRIWLAGRKSVLFITHSIPEAVFLADRVLVMSDRPGRIIDSVPVDLPRPRSTDTLGSADFTALCQYLRRYFE